MTHLSAHLGTGRLQLPVQLVGSVFVPNARGDFRCQKLAWPGKFGPRARKSWNKVARARLNLQTTSEANNPISLDLAIDGRATTTTLIDVTQFGHIEPPNNVGIEANAN